MSTPTPAGPGRVLGVPAGSPAVVPLPDRASDDHHPDTGSGWHSQSQWRRDQVTQRGTNEESHTGDWSQNLSAGHVAVTRRLTVPITALGVVVGVLAVAGLLIGWITGWAEFTVAGVSAVLVLLISAVFLIGRSSYAVSVDLHDARVVAGVRATGAIVVRNNGSRRTLPVRIELPVGPATASFRVPSLAARAAHEELFVIPTARRAVIDVGPALSVRGDPLGLLRRQVRWTVPAQLYVHPRTVPLHGTTTGSVKDLEGSPSTELSSNDVSFHALREYVPGDDRRYIHWKTSARTWVTQQSLMVRQFEETRRTHLVVALSVDPREFVAEAQFEIAVSVAASLGLQAFREERPVTVFAGSTPLVAGSARRLMDGCAGVMPDAGAGIIGSGRAAGAAVPNASVAVMVTGSVADPATMRRAASGFGVGTRVMGVRIEPGGTISLGSIGGVDVATLAKLDDLPTALRRMRAS